VGINPDRLESAHTLLIEGARDRPFRVVVVRGGTVVAEWCHGVARDEQLWLASACKSIYSSLLGIAIAEGKIASADAPLVAYYPEALDVPEGAGPKPGRFAFPKDKAVTFRQLISNTSGYMKPGEDPGKVFHYQTFGMNVLAHAIAKVYGLYDVRNPEGLPGLRQLVDEKLRLPICGTWGYTITNFEHPAGARTAIWGNYEGIKATAADMARLGWLWLNRGHWAGTQLVPDPWMREAATTAPDIVEHSPRHQWKYGYGFWTNDHGMLWPSLPRDSFAAAGSGSQHIWMCPSLDLVIVQSPGLWTTQEELDGGLLGMVVEAVA
jgi:CubicO group peptidase (beta-lactamase class C family)